MDENIIINCIGDSHVSIFNGSDTPSESVNGICAVDRIPYFRTHRVGPYLAWSVGNEKHEGHISTLNTSLEFIRENSYILFCFGAIDCRLHLPVQSEKTGRSLEEVTVECVNKYFNGFILKIFNEYNHKKIICMGPPSSAAGKGTDEQRNFCSKVFNEHLRKLCTDNNITFWTIYDDLLNEGWSVKKHLYYDGVHNKSYCLNFLEKDMEKLGILDIKKYIEN